MHALLFQTLPRDARGVAAEAGAEEEGGAEEEDGAEPHVAPGDLYEFSMFMFTSPYVRCHN